VEQHLKPGIGFPNIVEMGRESEIMRELLGKMAAPSEILGFRSHASKMHRERDRAFLP
jgi:hypothetical protein